jgi:hypothetical protein
MSPSWRYFASLGVCGLAVLASGQACAGAQASGVGCGPNVLVQAGAFVVIPTGTDDTANLQCAFDRAPRAGVRRIELIKGTYRTAQVVANNFLGSLAGAGAGKTVWRNLDQALAVTAVDFYLQPPGPANPWPSLLAFVDGHFRVSDLTIKIVGSPTQGWSIFGIEPPIQALAHGIVVVGHKATATIEDITIEGEALPGDLFGLNLINGIFFEGFLGADLTPLSGSFSVRNCAFRGIASPVPVFNLAQAEVQIVGNHSEQVLLGGEAVDFTDTRYLFLDNSVDAQWAGLDQYDNCLGASSECGITNSTLVISGNQFHTSGVVLEGTLGSHVSCRLVANDYDSITGPDVFLGPATHDCLVVGASSVEDHGTHNRIIP